MKKLMIRILTFAILALGFIALTIGSTLYWMRGDERYEGIGGEMLTSIGLFLLTILLFVYVLVHCTQRSKTDFPTLGEVVSRISMKKIWILILLLSFILSWVFRMQIYSDTHTTTITPPPGSTESHSEYHNPIFAYEVHQIGEQETRKRTMHVPNPLFFLIVYLYYRGVKKWSEVRTKE